MALFIDYYIVVYQLKCMIKRNKTMCSFHFIFLNGTNIETTSLVKS